LEIEEETDFSKFSLAEGVKHKELDVFGLPVDKSSKLYKQLKEREKYIEEDGEILFELNVGVDPTIPIAPNIDYEFKEMTDEQREVYLALNDEAEYEELEEDFVIQANDGDVPLKRKEERPDHNTVPEWKNEEDVNKFLESEVRDVKGDLISHKDFMDIIRGDAKELKVDLGKTKDSTQSKPLEPTQGVVAETRELLIQQLKQEIPIEQLMKMDLNELKAIHKRPKKGEIVVDQKVETAQGGGKIIFRKIVKVDQEKEQTKKVSYNDYHEDEEDIHDIREVEDDEGSDCDDSLAGSVDIEDLKAYQRELDQNVGQQIQSSDDDLNTEEEDYPIEEFDEENPVYVIDENKPHYVAPLKNEDDNYSISDDDTGLNNDELKALYKDYIERKRVTQQHKEQFINPNKIKAEPEPQEEDQEEHVERTEWDFKNDLAAQRVINEDDIKDEDIDADYRKACEPKPQASCPSAPQDHIKHQNFYCMKVVAEELDVKRKLISHSQTCKRAKDQNQESSSQVINRTTKRRGQEE